MSFRPAARQFFERRGAPTPPLPYDAEVEYLESTGGMSGYPAIDTGVPVVNAVVGTELDYSLTTSTPENDSWVFGMYNHSSGNGKNYLVGNYGGYNIYLYNAQYKPGTPYDIERHLVKINIDGKTTFDDVLLHDGTLQVSDSSGNYFNAFLFASHRNGTYTSPYWRAASARIYYCKMYVDGTMVRDFIPVRVGMEGAMYDRVSGALFRNAGTGAFTIGPDKS